GTERPQEARQRQAAPGRSDQHGLAAGLVVVAGGVVDDRDLVELRADLQAAVGRALVRDDDQIGENTGDLEKAAEDPGVVFQRREDDDRWTRAHARSTR